MGRVTSSQCMFATALEYERRLGLDLWDDHCPAIEGIEFAVAGGGAQPQLRWMPVSKTREVGGPASEDA